MHHNLLTISLMSTIRECILQAVECCVIIHSFHNDIIEREGSEKAEHLQSGGRQKIRKGRDEVQRCHEIEVQPETSDFYTEVCTDPALNPSRRIQPRELDGQLCQVKPEEENEHSLGYIDPIKV
jgi:hypothetical protein